MELEEIISKKKYGDIAEAGNLIGITKSNAAMAFKRPNSKHYEDVLEALSEIINNRESFLVNRGVTI